MTVLYLDVDGVLSPNAKGSGAWRDWEDIGVYGAMVSPTMGEQLFQLPVEKVWLTTWEDLANDHIVPVFGWEPLQVVQRRWLDEEPWWKLNAILHHIKHVSSPFIWVDDQLDPYYQGLAQRAAGDIPHLMIQTDEYVGITLKHLKRMKEFAEENR